MSFNSYFRKFRGGFLSIVEVCVTCFLIIYCKFKKNKCASKNPNKLRVLQYCEAYTLGGVLKVVERLSLGLGKSRKPEIELVLILIDKPEIKEYFEKVAQKSSFIVKMCYINLPSAYFSFKEFYDLRTLMRKEHFDIAHLHLYSPDSCRLGILAGRMAGVPIIITTEHLNSGDTTFRLNMLKRLNQHLIDRVIAVSKEIREHLIKERGMSSSKVVAIPNGVDLDNFLRRMVKGDILRKLRRDFIFDNDTVLIGTVAAFFKRKGHKYLLLAAKSIIKKHPNAKFIFIGDGGSKEALVNFVRDLDLMKSVEFVGYIEDVSPYYSIFDIFVLPSLAEGMPLSVLEALAIGVPVVATAVDGSKELILDGETGLLVPPKDVPALTKAIEYMIENPAKAREMGNAGMKRVREKYSLQESIKQIINVYLMHYSSFGGNDNVTEKY